MFNNILKKSFFILPFSLFLTGCFNNQPIIKKPIKIKFNNDENNKLNEGFKNYYTNNFIERKLATNEDELGKYTTFTRKYSNFKIEHIKKDLLDKNWFNILKLNIVINNTIYQFDIKENNYYLIGFKNNKILFFKNKCFNKNLKINCFTNKDLKSYIYIKYLNNKYIVKTKKQTKIFNKKEILKINDKYKLFF